MVTATMSDADIDVRSGIRTLEGPEPEPRAVIVPRQPGANESTLADAIDGVISQLAADGTLTQLSESRFGGDDLTSP